MKRLLLFFALCSSLGAWAQSVVKSVDGSTLTLTCTGNVGEMPDVQAPTGKKVFTNAAKEGNKYGKVLVDNGNMENYAIPGNECPSTTPFYLKVYTFTDPQTPDTEDKYALLQNVYLFDGTSTYTLMTTGSGVDAEGNYYSILGEVQQVSGEDLKSYLGGEAFSSMELWEFAENDMTIGWDASRVKRVQAGSAYDENKYYSKTQWNVVKFLSKDELIEEGYLVNAIKDVNKELYIVDSDNSYTVADGKAFNASLTFVKGVSFTEISDITSDTYTSLSTFVKLSDDKWRIRTEEDGEYVYTPVKDGDPYDATAVYVKANGATAQPITFAELEAKGFIADEMASTPYWKAMAAEIDAAEYTTIIFKSADSKNMAEINKTVTHEIMGCASLTTCDYGDVMIEAIESPYTDVTMSKFNEDNNGTFVFGNLPYSSKINNTLVKLVMPYIKNATKKVNGHNHYHVPYGVCSFFNALKDLTIPSNTTCIEQYAFNSGSGGFVLNKITLNEGLERIGKYAFTGTAPTATEDIPNYVTSLTIPSTVKYIASPVFVQGTLRDVYFTGTEAPIVELDAFGSKSYVNNNAYTRVSADTNWRGNRENYINGGYLAAMLHMPKNLTDAQKAAYTDITRDYHVFNYEGLEMDGQSPKKDADGNVIPYVIVPASKYKSNKVEEVESFSPTNGYSRTVYWNGNNVDAPTGDIASIGGFVCSSLDKNMAETGWATDHQAWGNVSAFYDTYVGENYSWPCQYDMCRSYAVATNGLLWDAVTTIGQGIINAGGKPTGTPDPEETEEPTEGTSEVRARVSTATTTVSYDSDCDGTDDVSFKNGAEYIGLHQFLFTTYDVSKETTTKEWTFDTVGEENWYTFCVPVDMTVAEVREAFGDGTQLCKLDHVYREKGKKVQFYFTDEQVYTETDLNKRAVVANYPYVIYPGYMEGAATVATFKLPNYTVAPTQVPTAVTKEVTDAYSGKKYTYTYVGQYNTQNNGTPLYMPQYCYYMGNAGKKVVDGKEKEYHKLFFQTGETGKWKPFTCVIIPSVGADDYVDFFGGKLDTQSEVKCISTFGKDTDEVTSIGDVEFICGANSGSAVYNLSGQKVATSLNGLQRGVYISGGKKYIVK